MTRHMPMPDGGCGVIPLSVPLPRPASEQAGMRRCLRLRLFPSQVPDRPGVLDPGRADHVQGVRDCLRGLASAAGEIADPSQCRVSGWASTAKARRLPLGAVCPAGLGFLGSLAKPRPVRKQCLDHTVRAAGARVGWGVPFVILDQI